MSSPNLAPKALDLTALLVICAAPAGALLPAPAATETEAPAQGAQIEETVEEGADERIAERISGIFSAIPSLEGVEVEVSEGVVGLGGTVTDPAAIARAEEIAERVSGVVTIENAIEREVSLERNLGLGPITEKWSEFLRMLPLIGAALVVALLIGGFGYLVASLSGFWRRTARNIFLAELIASAIRFVFIIGGIVIALDMIGASALLGAVLGGAGVIGIALGFAMRETIENYVASLMLSLRQPFRPNDHVVIGEDEGRVIRLTSRATVLMTLDGNHLRIPNSTVFKAVILNYTRNPQRRFDFMLGIDADDDPTGARALGTETLAALDFVLTDPAPEVYVAEVGDSNIVLNFLGWIDQREADWNKARSRAIAAVKSALEDAGFAIPEPIYRLRFDPRSPPLPLENVAERPDTTRPAPTRAASQHAPVPEEDVAPRNEVAEMVERERKFAGEQEKDLLDPARPVE